MMRTKIIWVTPRFGLEELDKEHNLAFLCVIEMESWGVEMELGSRFVLFKILLGHAIEYIKIYKPRLGEKSYTCILAHKWYSKPLDSKKKITLGQ